MRSLCLTFLGLILLFGCGKDKAVTPVKSNPDGRWTYTTPDNSISVEFDLKSTASGSVEILNPVIVVLGTTGVAAAQMTDINVPSIGTIRINANDSDLVHPFSITFTNCTLSSDFTKILVVEAEYTYPWGFLKKLSNINIIRKE